MKPMLGVNAPRLPDNCIWRVGLVARRFYCLEASPKGCSLERFPTLPPKKKRGSKVIIMMYRLWTLWRTIRKIH